MTITTLFGLALAPLYAAIAQVESERGKTSDNVYQIDAHIGGCYIKDVNLIIIKKCAVSALTYRQLPDCAKLNRHTSEYMMSVYWQHWGKHYEKKTGKPVTYEVLARIHNGGPLGWKKPSTVAYWEKVRRVLETQTKAEIEAWTNGGAK